MKKPLFLFAALCTLFLLSGCIKDTVKRTYTYTLSRPIYTSVAEVRANIRSNAPVQVAQPGKLFIQGAYIFLNEVDKGVHVIDNSNPAAPKNVAFVNVPGNVDLAVKGNILYADMYNDLVTLDISDPLNVKLKDIDKDVFPHRAYYPYFYDSVTQQYRPDSSVMVTGWSQKDTTVAEEFNATTWGQLVRQGVAIFNSCMNCSMAEAVSVRPAAAKAAGGMGGSMARFTIVGERLYTVDWSTLNVFNIDDPAAPFYVSNQIFNRGGIETIYPFKGKLFIGSMDGMYIYSIDNADKPEQLSRFLHVRACDPVVADDTHAYVTLRSGVGNVDFADQLDGIDIANINQPSLVRTYPIKNPHGLSKEGDLLFICDGAAGLKLYDAAKPGDLKLLNMISGINTYDVIAYDGLAIVVAQDGLHQYDYSNPRAIKKLSRIAISK